jgi:hypothetical protein
VSDRPANRLPRGTFWRSFSAGDPVGKPLAEKAYRTWRFLDGIVCSDLTASDTAIQRETVICWFMLNCRPFDPSDDPPVLAHIPGGLGPLAAGGGGFGRGADGRGGYGVGSSEEPSGARDALSAGPFAAIYPIAFEFTGTLPDAALSDISNELPGEWVWTPTRIPSEALGVVVRDEALLRADLASQLAEIESAFLALGPAYGAMGHNSGIADPELSQAEEQALLVDLRRMRATSASASAKDLKDAWSTISQTLRRLMDWLGGRITLLVDESIKRMVQLAFVVAAAKLIDAVPAVEQILKALDKLH